MPRLLPCSSCHRHVSEEHQTCPFCEFGPLRCEAPTPRRWLLTLAAGSLGLLAACDDDGSNKPATTSAPVVADSGAEPSGAEGDGGAVTSAEPVQDDAGAKDVYGEPRIEENADPPPAVDSATAPEDGGGAGESAEARPAEPTPTIYGGPRMMDGEQPEPAPTPEPAAEAEPKPKAPSKKIYGGPRRDEP